MSYVEQTTEYRYPGDFVLSNLDIISTDGKLFSLIDLQSETNIYQNIFKPFMQIEIAIQDAAGLLNALKGGVSGGEIIYVSFKTADPAMRSNSLVFLVNKISNRFRHSDGNERYIIEGYSVEHFTTIDKKISKSYGGSSGNQISNIVQSIYDEFILTKEVKSIYTYLKNNNRRPDKSTGLGKLKKHRTTGLHKCIIPNMNPIQAIQYLIKDSIDDDIASKFLFFETFNGFQFRSLGKLVTEDPDEFADRYVYYPSNDYQAVTASKAFFNIIDMSRVKDVDITDNMSQGLFSATTIEVDPLRKKSTTTVYDYQKEFTRFNTLNKIKIPGGSNQNAIVHLKTSRRGHDTDSVFDKEGVLSSRNVLKDPIRDSYFKHITNNILSLTLYGNSKLNVGDTINAEFSPATSYDVPEGDKYTSGKYLIFKVRHKFNKSQYNTIVECVKDTGLKE